MESTITEIQQLKQKLEQVAENDTQRANTQDRLSDCESAILKMKEKIAELESVIEEQGMKVKRNKSFMFMEIGGKTKQLL